MFGKLICSNMFESRTVCERSYGSTAQPALLQARIKSELITFHM